LHPEQLANALPSLVGVTRRIDDREHLVTTFHGVVGRA
jgi:hypothetical protein